MTMRWRARLAWLAAVAAVIPASIWRPHLSPAALAALGSAVALVLCAVFFLAFRCPHCGARQLRVRWDWLLMGTRCWRCQQLLDGAAVSDELLEEQLLAEINPQLAANRRRERLVLDELRGRAAASPAAAEQLHRELAARVKHADEWLAVVRREAPSVEPQAQRTLAGAQEELRRLGSHGS